MERNSAAWRRECRLLPRGSELALGLVRNVDLQVLSCLCALGEGLDAEGEEGVRQPAAQAAEQKEEFLRVLWEKMRIPFLLLLLTGNI